MPTKAPLFLALAVAAATAAATRASAGAPIREALPHAAGIEVLSKSVLYGLFYDQALSDTRWVVGGGLTRTFTSETEKVTVLIPIYANYYFLSEADFLASAGAIVVTNAGAVSGESPVLGRIRFWDFPALPFLGTGYEHRADNGFLARAQVNLVFSRSFAPSAGFSLGYVF